MHVEVTLHDADAAAVPDGVQLLDPLPGVLGDEQLRTADLPKILRRIHGRELFGQQINGYVWGERSLRFQVAESASGVWDLAAFTVELETRVAADVTGEDLWHVETIAVPRTRALLAVDVPGLGLSAVSEQTAPNTDDPVHVSERSLSNRALVATVNDDGTVRIETAGGAVIDGALALVDEGDCGDSYNYGPVDDVSAVREPVTVETSVIERGPLRGRLRIRRIYDVPVSLGADRVRAERTVPLVTDTVIELREGEGMLRVTIDYVNTASDHRLRVLVPTGAAGLPASRSVGQYGTTVRGREAEGGWGEFPLPTYPAYRLAAAGEIAVLVRKLTEYELVSDPGRDDALALTLSRSVGMMSVNLHPLRDEPAGSEIPVPGAQYLGVSVRTELAITVGADEPTVIRAADVFGHDPLCIRGTGAVDGPLPERAVDVEVSGDVVLESIRRVEDEAELRFVNYLGEQLPLGVAAPGAWMRTDLTGAVIDHDIDLSSALVSAGSIVSVRLPLPDAASEKANKC